MLLGASCFVLAWTRLITNAGSMSSQRRRPWANSNPALVIHPVLLGAAYPCCGCCRASCCCLPLPSPLLLLVQQPFCRQEESNAGLADVVGRATCNVLAICPAPSQSFSYWLLPRDATRPGYVRYNSTLCSSSNEKRQDAPCIVIQLGFSPTSSCGSLFKSCWLMSHFMW